MEGSSILDSEDRMLRMGVIEHKRCPTGNISQQQNQSQNRPVQNANTPHAAKACRLRAARRAECASENAPGARRTTRRLRAARRAGLRAGRRAGCASQDAPGARRKTRCLRAEGHAVCAPGGALVARRVRARARLFFFRGGGRSLEVVMRWGLRVADGAAFPGRLERGAFLSLLAATGSSILHLS